MVCANGSTTSEKKQKNNSFLKNVERAPYEIGHLLRHLPDSAVSSKRQPEEVYQVADAIARHANNATTALLQGLEAIGAVIYSAAMNAEYPVRPSTLEDLGCLIKHLAVEAQFLFELEQDCNELVKSGEEFGIAKGGAQ